MKCPNCDRTHIGYDGIITTINYAVVVDSRRYCCLDCYHRWNKEKMK